MASSATIGSAPTSRWLVEPRRWAVVRNRPGAHWLTLAAVCVGAFMGQLDASIVTVALPTLQRSFHSGVGAVTWVGLGYLLVLVASVTAVGRFADMWGRKLLYVYGFLVFVGASALCALAPNLGALIGFRMLQAVGAAMLQANSVAIIVQAVPRRALGRAIGVQGAAQAVGLALGPSIGGLLLAAGGWRLIFLVNVPFGLLGAAAAVALVPRSRALQERVAFDWLGLALFFPAVIALLSAISFGATGGFTSTAILGLLAGAVVLGAAFIVRERTTAHPMLDLRLFRRRRFSAGIVAGLLSYLVMFGLLFVVPFYLEGARGLGAGRTGVELMVMPLALGVAAPVAGRLAERVGPRPLTVGGMVLAAVGLVALALLRPSDGMFVVLLAVVGAGLGLFTPSNNAAVMGAAPLRQSGVASGVLNMTRGMGTALGLAVTGLIFSSSAGAAAGSPSTAHAFSVTVLCLAGVAVVAAAVSSVGHGWGKPSDRVGLRRSAAGA